MNAPQIVRIPLNDARELRLTKSGPTITLAIWRKSLHSDAWSETSKSWDVNERAWSALRQALETLTRDAA